MRLAIVSLCGVLAAASPAGAPLTFTDVTQAAGIHFRHNSGAFGKKYLPETLGSGCVFLDVDNDGWQDIFLVNSKNWPGQHGRAVAIRRCTTTTTTAPSPTSPARRASRSRSTVMGVSAADYDNDGNIDLYVTALGPNHLFRNLGNGKFEDVTAKAGVGDPGFSTSATLVRLRQGRQARPRRGELRRVDAGEGPVLLAGREGQVVLHARSRTRARAPRCITTAATARSRT